MVRVVVKDEHRELLTFEEAYDALYDCCLDWAAHAPDLVNDPRTRVFVPETNVRITVHTGATHRRGAIGTLLHTETPRSDETAQEYGGTGEPVYTLYDADTAALKGIVIGDIQLAGFPSEGLRGCQTAVDAAVDIDLVTGSDAADVGIFGSGKQAKHHLMVIDRLRDVERVRVFSPTRAHREAFERRMNEFVDADVRAVDGPEAVIEGADVVVCATNASSPVFDGDLLEPGQTVISIVASGVDLVDVGGSPQRRREIDDTTVARADLYVTRSVKLAREAEMGDFYHPIQAGVLDWDDVVEIRDIVGGTHPGRETDDQLVVYKQNSRQGITEAALLSALYEKAVDAGVGTDL